MVGKLMTAAATILFLVLSPAAFAQQTGGTADEAKAMLMKAEAAVKEDQAKALDMFNKGEGGFLDRDLYVFCANTSDGKVVAVGNPNAKQNLGLDLRTIKGPDGSTKGGEDIYAAMQKLTGEITEVKYMIASPTSKTPIPKVSFVTRVSSDLGCGVGYYPPQK
jgi:hypothetical protein